MAISTKSKRRESSKPKQRWDIAVHLIVRGFEEPAERISATLQLKPSSVWRAGEPVYLPEGHKHKDNGWRLTAPCPRSAPLQEHLNALIAEVKNAAPRFQDLPKNTEVYVFCGITDYERTVDLSFPPGVTALAGRIGAGIHISYYDLSDVPAESV